jgi:ATP-binding cassette subfamily C protein
MLIDLRHSYNSISRLYKDVYELRGSEHQCTLVDKGDSIEKFQTLTFDKVGFYYSGTRNEILSNVSFVINSGDSIGIIGQSGSGKTTVIDLLLGLLSPTEGRVLFNDKSTSDKSVLRQLRRQVAYIPQDIFLLDDTLENNITLGDKNPDNNKIIESIRQAQLYSMMQNSSDGLNTLLGERGVRVSGGQRQRIALARAFYHDRDIIVMDEATSALDSKTEAEITKEIRSLRKNKTVIIIAHRVTTLQNCNHIFKLENGVLKNIGDYKNI